MTLPARKKKRTVSTDGIHNKKKSGLLEKKYTFDFLTLFRFCLVLLGLGAGLTLFIPGAGYGILGLIAFYVLVEVALYLKKREEEGA